MAENYQEELNKFRKNAVTTVGSLMVATVLLAGVASLSGRFLSQRHDESLEMAYRITILVLGLGAVTLRRTRFNAMRLKDIGGISGASGLIRYLAKTTLLLSLVGAAIATLGIVLTVITGIDRYTYIAGIVALAVFLYSYPTEASWQRTIRKFASPSD